jgi:hypothetical protein
MDRSGKVEIEDGRREQRERRTAEYIGAPGRPKKEAGRKREVSTRDLVVEEAK